jgi:hypothetical protein
LGAGAELSIQLIGEDTSALRRLVNSDRSDVFPRIGKLIVAG